MTVLDSELDMQSNVAVAYLLSIVIKKSVFNLIYANLTWVLFRMYGTVLLTWCEFFHNWSLKRWQWLQIAGGLLILAVGNFVISAAMLTSLYCCSQFDAQFFASLGTHTSCRVPQSALRSRFSDIARLLTNKLAAVMSSEKAEGSALLRSVSS